MSPAFPFEVVLTAPIPAELVSDVQGKWHYVSESLVGIQLEADRRTVRFGLKAGAEDQADRVREKLAQIAGVMVKGYRGGAAKVVLDRSWKEFPFRTDPHPELESRGLVIRLGPGRYALSGDARALLELAITTAPDAPRPRMDMAELLRRDGDLQGAARRVAVRRWRGATWRAGGGQVAAAEERTW